MPFMEKTRREFSKGIIFVITVEKTKTHWVVSSVVGD
jgi:hypothetical protein